MRFSLFLLFPCISLLVTLLAVIYLMRFLSLSVCLFVCGRKCCLCVFEKNLGCCSLLSLSLVRVSSIFILNSVSVLFHVNECLGLLSFDYRHLKVIHVARHSNSLFILVFI